MNYFNNTMSETEAKAIYRKMAVQLHPDKATGSKEAFVDLQNQYEQFLKGNCGFTAEKAEQETEAMDNFIRANEFIQNFAGVTVELTGTWVWLTGNTFVYRDAIKENGFKYSASKKRWYKAPYEIKGTKRKGTSFSKIKETYGYSAVTIADTTAKLY
jgi:hypothetical protein